MCLTSLIEITFLGRFRLYPYQWAFRNQYKPSQVGPFETDQMMILELTQFMRGDFDPTTFIQKSGSQSSELSDVQPPL